MDREVDAMGYGICIFSADTVQDFLKREKIRKRKLLSLLQKDKELYLSTQKEGILIPLVGINAYNYAIRLEGRDEPFDDRWTQKIDYDGFNLEIKDGLWISNIRQLEPFEPKIYHERKKNFIPRRDSLNRWSGTARHGNGGIRRKRERESLLKFIQISNMMSLPENICCLSKVMSERKNRSTLFRIVAFIFR